MNTTLTIKTAIIALTLGFTSISANAQLHRYRYYGHGHHATTVVVHTPSVSNINNRFTQTERLGLAVAYLKNHHTISIKKYAKLTGLPRDTAEAELDAFTANRRNRIVSIINGKRKVYTLKR